MVRAERLAVRFSPYVGGVGTFRAICHEVAEKGYEGLVLSRHETPIPASVSD